MTPPLGKGDIAAPGALSLSLFRLQQPTPPADVSDASTRSFSEGPRLCPAGIVTPSELSELAHGPRDQRSREPPRLATSGRSQRNRQRRARTSGASSGRPSLAVRQGL